MLAAEFASMMTWYLEFQRLAVRVALRRIMPTHRGACGNSFRMNRLSNTFRKCFPHENHSLSIFRRNILGEKAH